MIIKELIKSFLITRYQNTASWSNIVDYFLKEVNKNNGIESKYISDDLHEAIRNIMLEMIESGEIIQVDNKLYKLL